MSGPTLLEHAAGLLFDAALHSSLLLGASFVLQRGLRSTTATTQHTVWAVVLAALPWTVAASAIRSPELASTWTWTVGVWLAGCLACLGVQAVGWVQLWRLGRSATPAPHLRPTSSSPTVWTVATDQPAPFTWGIWRPVIAIPIHPFGTPAQRDAALTHERAHIARHDWLAHTLAGVVCAVFWFQPLVWLARSALVQQAEHAADDAVLAAGFRPTTYARLLVDLATQRPTPALGIARSSVGQRVRAVLSPGRPRPTARSTRWPSAVLTTALFASAVAALPTSAAWIPDPPPPECESSPGDVRWHAPLWP